MEIASYTDTAYDSRHPRALGPQTQDIGIAERQIRRYPIKSRGVHCREYLADASAWLTVKKAQTLTDVQIEKIKAEAKDQDIIMRWGTWKNPLVVVDAITKLAGFFAFGGGVVTLLALFYEGFSLDILYTPGILFIVPYALYQLGRIVQKRGWVSNKNNTVLNRCTGMVSFIHKKKRIALPFDEFDPFLVPFTDPTGGTHYALNLMHRYSYKSVAEQRNYYEPWQGELGWEMIQQFMDISQPLPDLPEYELTRAYDPTTLVYDRDHQRDPNYWRSQDPERVYAWGQAARKAAKTLPLGQTACPGPGRGLAALRAWGRRLAG